MSEPLDQSNAQPGGDALTKELLDDMLGVVEEWTAKRMILDDGLIRQARAIYLADDQMLEVVQKFKRQAGMTQERFEAGEQWRVHHTIKQHRTGMLKTVPAVTYTCEGSMLAHIEFEMNEQGNGVTIRGWDGYNRRVF